MQGRGYCPAKLREARSCCSSLPYVHTTLILVLILLLDPPPDTGYHLRALGALWCCPFLVMGVVNLLCDSDDGPYLLEVSFNVNRLNHTLKAPWSVPFCFD